MSHACELDDRCTVACFDSVVLYDPRNGRGHRFYACEAHRREAEAQGLTTEPPRPSIIQLVPDPAPRPVRRATLPRAPEAAPAPTRAAATPRGRPSTARSSTSTVDPSTTPADVVVATLAEAAPGVASARPESAPSSPDAASEIGGDATPIDGAPSIVTSAFPGGMSPVTAADIGRAAGDGAPEPLETGAPRGTVVGAGNGDDARPVAEVNPRSRRWTRDPSPAFPRVAQDCPRCQLSVVPTDWGVCQGCGLHVDDFVLFDVDPDVTLSLTDDPTHPAAKELAGDQPPVTEEPDGVDRDADASVGDGASDGPGTSTLEGGGEPSLSVPEHASGDEPGAGDGPAIVAGDPASSGGAPTSLRDPSLRKALEVDPAAPTGRCRIVGCERRWIARGLCCAHHAAARRHGRLEELASPPVQPGGRPPGTRWKGDLPAPTVVSDLDNAGRLFGLAVETAFAFASAGGDIAVGRRMLRAAADVAADLIWLAASVRACPAVGGSGHVSTAHP